MPGGFLIFPAYITVFDVLVFNVWLQKREKEENEGVVVERVLALYI